MIKLKPGYITFIFLFFADLHNNDEALDAISDLLCQLLFTYKIFACTKKKCIQGFYFHRNKSFLFP